jgi:hypothetical protein
LNPWEKPICVQAVNAAIFFIISFGFFARIDIPQGCCLILEQGRSLNA